MVAALEKKLGQKLHTVGFDLNNNELPLRAFFLKKFDQVTKPPNHFTGTKKNG